MAATHECVFVEEQEPNGRLILPPCIVCGVTAMDALDQLRELLEQAEVDTERKVTVEMRTRLDGWMQHAYTSDREVQALRLTLGTIYATWATRDCQVDPQAECVDDPDADEVDMCDRCWLVDLIRKSLPEPLLTNTLALMEQWAAALELLCKCGHMHIADEADTDAGCRVCTCRLWSPGLAPAQRAAPWYDDPEGKPPYLGPIP